MTTQELSKQTCIPCQGGVPALSEEERAPLLSQLQGWEVIEGHHLSKDFLFDNFIDALHFAKEAGRIAEEQGHHPEMTIGWGHVLVEIWTHKIDGLVESDFYLAAKYDAI